MALRKNRESQSGELSEPFIEGNQFQVGSFCKCCQVGIGPEVDIKKDHSKSSLSTRRLRRREFHKFVRSSGQCFRALRSEPVETLTASYSRKHGISMEFVQKLSQPSPRATKRLRLKPLHRYVLVLKFPYLYCGASHERSQVFRNLEGIQS